DRPELQRDAPRRIFTPNGIPEVEFLYYIYPIYAALIAWRKRAGARHLVHGTEADITLDSLDAFTIRVANYMVQEYSRGRGADVRNGLRREKPRELGVVDPYVWEKLYAYLQAIYMELRAPMSANDHEEVQAILDRHGISYGTFDG